MLQYRMPDKKEGSYAIDVVGAKAKDTEGIRTFLETSRNEYLRIINEISVDRKDVDPRILSFENKMHSINKQRAESYGKTYTPPTVVYLNRPRAIDKADEINRRLNEEAPISFRPFDASAGSFEPMIGIVVVFVNNFNDTDLDAYDTTRKLRHELSHAGSINKLKARYRVDENRTDLTILEYRTGLYVSTESPRKGQIKSGTFLDEAFHAIEDRLFEGEEFDFLPQDEFLTQQPEISILYPHESAKYNSLKAEAVKRGLMADQDMLASYFIEGNSLYHVGAEIYDINSDLLLEIFKKDPSLYLLARGAIYGDRIQPFTQRLESQFGRGFFRRIMNISTREEARILLAEII